MKLSWLSLISSILFMGIKDFFFTRLILKLANINWWKVGFYWPRFEKRKKHLSFHFSAFLVGSRESLVLVGRARFELATNGLKVRCSTDWATDPAKTEIIAIILFWSWKRQAPILKPQSALLRGDSWQSSPLFPTKSPLQSALGRPRHWALPLLLGY